MYFDDFALACEEKKVVDGTEYSKQYTYANVLIDSCDDQNTGSNYKHWVAPDGASGEAAFFTVDLGCQRCVSNVTLRNSQNGITRNR